MELKLLSGGAANGLVTALEDEIRGETGASVTGDFGAVGGMRDRVREAVDVIILTRRIVTDLADAGHADAATVADLGRVVTGIGVQEGAAAADACCVTSRGWIVLIAVDLSPLFPSIIL